MNTLKRAIALCVIATSTLVLCHADSPSANTVSKTKSQPLLAKTPNERLFLSRLPLMHQAYNARVSHVNACRAEMRKDFPSVQSQRGIDAFIEDAWTWSTTKNALTNSPEFKQKLAAAFRKHVLQIDAIRRNISTKGKKLEQGLHDIDSDLIVDLGIDCDLGQLKRSVDTIDLVKLNRQLDQLGDALGGLVHDAVISSLQGNGIALASGAITGKVAEHLMSADGEYTWLEWIVAAGAGMAMDYAVDTEIQASAKAALAKEVKKLRDRVNRDVTDPNGVMGGVWSKEVIASFYSHNTRTVTAAARAIGVDTAWALSHF